MSEISKDEMPRKIKPNRTSENQIATNNMKGVGGKRKKSTNNAEQAEENAGDWQR